MSIGTLALAGATLAEAAPVENVLVEVARALVLIAFIAAAATKSLDIHRFARDLGRSFAQLRGAGAITLAATIVIAEWAIVALILVGGDAARFGLLAALALLAAFTALVAWSVIFDRGLVCSCFGGASGHRMNVYDLIRNLLLMAAAGFAWRLAPGGDALDSLATRSLSMTIAITTIGGIAFLLITSLQGIALLLRAESGR